MKKLFLLGPLFLLCTALYSQTRFYQHGGGEDYVDTVSNYTILVRNKNELLTALQKVKISGSIIYVSDTAEIDLSDEMDLNINAGVTLASGRGKKGSLGALLYSNYHMPIGIDVVKNSLFLITNNNVRITGLRLRGPDGGKNPENCNRQDPSAIHISGLDYAYKDDDTFTNKLQNVLIDNNEMYNWPNACVDVNFVSGVRILYNFIHHNLRESTGNCRHYGLGYGINNNGGSSFIYRNIFAHNRHDVACTGNKNSSYVFTDNLVLRGGTHQSVDVHGWHETNKNPPTHPDGTYIAGNYFEIERNYFLHTGARFYRPTILIRGVPVKEVNVKNNHFAKWKSNAIQQKLRGSKDGETSVYQKMNVHSNKFNLSSPSIIFISFSGKSLWSYRKFKENKSLFNLYNGPVLINKMQRSVLTKTYVTGNFSGDGRQDLFYSDGENWFISESGKKDWLNINHSTINPADLRFHDFDGDGLTDIFRTNGNQWYVSAHGGKDNWAEWNNSNAPLSQLMFGDFDGNGKTDVLRVADGKWRISWEGKGSWEDLNTSDVTVSELLLGDFDGNGKTDVLRVADGKWRISREGKGSWEDLNTSTSSINDLRIGDFNGDGAADIFRINGGKWEVSYNATSEWQTINSASQSINFLFFGDLNGDKKTDVLATIKD